MPNIYGEERPSKTKKKAKAPSATVLGTGGAGGAGRLIGSRQQQIESAVSPIGKTSVKKDK